MCVCVDRHGQMVMDASKCGQVEIGKSCTVSCGEGFAGESIFTCQRDGVSQKHTTHHSPLTTHDY